MSTLAQLQGQRDTQTHNACDKPNRYHGRLRSCLVESFVISVVADLIVRRLAYSRLFSHRAERLYSTGTVVSCKQEHTFLQLPAKIWIFYAAVSAMFVPCEMHTQ